MFDCRVTAVWLNTRAAAFACLAAVGACGAGPEWAGNIEERDGVVYVSNPRDGLWQDRDAVPVRFELERVFGADTAPADEILGSVERPEWHGVAVDGDGNVYIYDDSVSELVSFAADGSLRWRAGREGQGPGEFNGVGGIAWNGGSSIYVGTGNGQRLAVWDTDGNFLTSHSLANRGLPKGMLVGFLDPTTLVLENPAPPHVHAGGTVGVIDIGGEWATIAEFEVDVANTDMGRDRAFISMRVSGGWISVGDIDSYDLRFWDRGGALKRVIARDFERMVGHAVSDEMDLGVTYSILFPAVLLPSGHWLANSMWAEVDDPDADVAVRWANGTSRELPWHASIDVFDPEGRFLYAHESEGRFPEFGVIQTIGPDGKLYTSVLDPFPQVRRYRVEIDGS